VFRNDARPAARAALLNSNVNSSVAGITRRNGFDVLEERGESDEEFNLARLKPLREARTRVAEGRGESLTDVRLHRVICRAGRGGVCVALKAGR
jgi:hypothetical protein